MSPAPVAIGSNLQRKTPGSGINKPRALVVDDSLTILHAICALLEHHEIVELVGRAESGEEAIDAALALRPDLVLMDADMPGMSGLRASLMLWQVCPTTRVVLMTMDRSPELRRACCSCGAFAVIYKPTFLSELAELVNGEAFRRATARAHGHVATIMR